MSRMTKEMALVEADRLGIDNAAAMSWPELQKAIARAQRIEELVPDQEQKIDEHRGTTTPSKPVVVRRPAKIKVIKGGQQKIDINKYRGKIAIMAPEIRLSNVARYKYDEELGDGIEVEETYYNGETLDARNTDSASGTYRIVGNSNSKVVAQSTLPQENVGVTQDIVNDWFPVYTYGGRQGYALHDVKQMLMGMGEYEKYRDRLHDSPSIFYAGHKFVCVDKGLVHYIMREIEEDRAWRKEHGRK